MGCDIHGVVQGNNIYRGWEDLLNVGQIIDRHYHAFYVLFGVRGSDTYSKKPLFANRDYPLDFCEQDWYKLEQESKKDIIENRDYHSASWLSSKEIEIIPKNYIKSFGEDWELLFDLTRRLARYSRYKEVRIVVWFDN